MTKSAWVIGFLVFYVAVLAYMAWRLSRQTTSDRMHLFGNGFGAVMSLFGTAASLFSTFTLIGMPQFFKDHGVGAWVFLGITDVCLAAFLLYFGLKMRQFTRKLALINQGHAPKNLLELLKQSHMPRWVIGYFILANTLFMIPYVAIGIKGSASLLQGALPLGATHLSWSILMVMLMLIYSWAGGMKALFVTDTFQGLLLLITVWAIALFAIDGAGGVTQLFATAKMIEPRLMSAPGPQGLFQWQFLLISFLSIVCIPYVQPQMTTRILIAKDDKAFARSTTWLAVFAFLVILPTVFIGLRAVAVNAQIANTVTSTNAANFLINVLNSDTPIFFFGLFIIGALAADMSTISSQLLSIGTEWRSVMLKGDIQDYPSTKVLVSLVGAGVAFFALLLAQTSFKSLILFAINSFIGTSLLLPVVVASTLGDTTKRQILCVVSLIATLIYLPVLLEFLPKMLGGLRVELYLYAVCIALMLWAKLTDTGYKGHQPLPKMAK